MARLAAVLALLAPLALATAPGIVPHEPWRPEDNPIAFGDAIGEEFNFHLDALPREGAAPAPWVTAYYPSVMDGINVSLPGQDVPAVKYAKAFGLDPKQTQLAVSKYAGWGAYRSGTNTCDSDDQCSAGSSCVGKELYGHGFCVAPWYGLCHASSAASTLEPEPRCNVSFGGQTFTPFDLKGLMTIMYHSYGYPDKVAKSAVTIVSQFCTQGETYRSHVEKQGRTGCVQINAGSFHIALGNMIGLKNKHLLTDIRPLQDIHNYPIYKYKVDRMSEISLTEAARRFNRDRYNEINPQAARIYNVATTIFYMSNPDTYDNHVEAHERHTTPRQYTYFLEVDAQGKIVGGQWLGEYGPDVLWTANHKQDWNHEVAGMSYRFVHELVRRSSKCL